MRSWLNSNAVAALIAHNNLSRSRVGAESITLAYIPLRNPSPKPLHALLRAAMCKTFRDNVALSALLNSVVAYLGGGIQALLYVAFFENFSFLVCRMGPDPGKTISL